MERTDLQVRNLLDDPALQRAMRLGVSHLDSAESLQNRTTRGVASWSKV